MRRIVPSTRSARRRHWFFYVSATRLARTTSFFCFWLAFATLRSAFAADEPIAWRTGAEFQKEWANPVGITWNQAPIRNALTSVSRTERIAMVLDRRIDPQRTVNLAGDLEPLEIVCQRIAGKLNAGVCRVGPVVYFGPSSTTQKLATVAALRRAEVEALGASRKERIGAKPFHWDTLAEPRTLVKNLAAELGLTVAEPNDLPHDLWPEQNLPPLVWSDRLTLVLAGFDLTFQIDEASNRLLIVPMPHEASLEKSYVVKGNANKVATDLIDKFPQAEIRAANGRVAVKGAYEDHELIERLVRGEKISRPQVVNRESVYTLRVENQPVGGVLRAIAERLKLSIDFAPDTHGKLEQRVTFSVDKVLIDDLLAASTRDTGLRHEIRDGRLLIRLAP